MIFAIPLLAGARIGKSIFFFEETSDQVKRSDLDLLLDTSSPEDHCQMHHDHKDDNFNDWERSLKWSADDCGHNEGVGPVIKLAVKNGLSFPELMRGCPDSERYIPPAEEVIENPDELDQYAGLLSSSQLATPKKMLKERKRRHRDIGRSPGTCCRGSVAQESNDEICQLAREEWESRGRSCYRHSIPMAQLPGIQMSPAASC
jgi:hypothetical protein